MFSAGESTGMADAGQGVLDVPDGIIDPVDLPPDHCGDPFIFHQARPGQKHLQRISDAIGDGGEELPDRFCRIFGNGCLSRR